MAGLSSVAVDVVRAWRAGRGSGGPKPFQILCRERGEKGPGCTFRPRAKRVRCSLGGCAGDVTSGPAREGSLVLRSGPSGLGGGGWRGGGGIRAGAHPTLILAAESAYVTRVLALGRAPRALALGRAPSPSCVSASPRCFFIFCSPVSCWLRGGSPGSYNFPFSWANR